MGFSFWGVRWWTTVVQMVSSKPLGPPLLGGWESANYFDPSMPGSQHGNAKGSFRRPGYQEHWWGLCLGAAFCEGKGFEKLEPKWGDFGSNIFVERS